MLWSKYFGESYRGLLPSGSQLLFRGETENTTLRFGQAMLPKFTWLAFSPEASSLPHHHHPGDKRQNGRGNQGTVSQEQREEFLPSSGNLENFPVLLEFSKSPTQGQNTLRSLTFSTHITGLR